MAAFGEMLQRLRAERDLSLSALARVTHYNKGYLSKVERGIQRPTEDLARLCDAALVARGDLVAAAHLDIAALHDAQPWQTTELLRRIQASDTTAGTLDALEATVTQLCCDYPHRAANELITDARAWLRHIAHVLRKPTGLRAHQQLLVSAGWLALLVGCLEYDLGLRTSAEATRAAARQLGDEAGHNEIVGWTYEMSSWFALTQRRYQDALHASRAGQQAGDAQPVAVQLIAQEAKALGRMQNPAGVREALERGQSLLAGFPMPDRPEHHFVVDPTKWGFYAMDAHRMAGDDNQAKTFAQEVLANSVGPDGDEHAPMRMAEAHPTLAVVSARQGDLEEATTLGIRALQGPRKSLPSLLMVAGELDVELDRRSPGESATAEFRNALRMVR